MDQKFRHLNEVIVELKKCKAALHQASEARFRGSHSQKEEAKTLHHKLAIQFSTLWSSLIPAQVAAALDAAKRGDGEDLETLVSYLEWDAQFFRSGYIKAEILRAIKRLDLSSHADRLRLFVLKKIDQGASQEFKEIRRLALHLSEPMWLSDLQRRSSIDLAPQVRWRAKSVLQAIANEASRGP